MDKPVKVLLRQMQTKKFRREEESILVTLFSDKTIMKLVQFIIALAVTLEIIDKFNPSVKCFPIGRTWKKSVDKDGKQNKFNSVKDIRDYNYMDFINIHCETQISDYSKHKSYLAWRKTCPVPGTSRRRRAIEADFTDEEEESAMTIEGSHDLIVSTDRRMKRQANQKPCDDDLDQEQAPLPLNPAEIPIGNKTYNTVGLYCNSPEKRSESLSQLIRGRAGLGAIFKYIMLSMQPGRLYDCRPRTLYYYFMSWALLIYALIIGAGPLLWNFLFEEKIADRIRHIKAFVESVTEDCEDPSEAPKRKHLIESQMKSWNSSKMTVVAYVKVVWTIVWSALALLMMLRVFRGDIDNLGLTICKVHNFEYAKCAAPRSGLVYFVWLFALLILCLISALALFNFVSLVLLTRNRQTNNTFLINLLSQHLGEQFEQTLRGCCSDMMIIAHLCKKNRKLFGSNYGRIRSSKSTKGKDEQETVL